MLVWFLASTTRVYLVSLVVLYVRLNVLRFCIFGVVVLSPYQFIVFVRPNPVAFACQCVSLPGSSLVLLTNTIPLFGILIVIPRIPLTEASHEQLETSPF